MATSPTITAWDEQGNPIKPGAPAKVTAWDENGKPVAPTVLPSSIGPDTRGVIQRLGDWYTRKPAYEGTLSSPGMSPREKVQEVAKGAAVGSVPLIGGGLAMAPASTLLGLGGSVLGGYGGSKLGEWAGQKEGAPELGEDIGGLAGSFFGGLAGSRAGIPRVLGNKAAELLRNPATPRQSQLGRPGSVKDILPPQLQRWTVPTWMIPKGEVGTPTNPGPFMEVPARAPQVQPEVDPVVQAVREGRAAKLPARMPTPAKAAPPPLFPGATASDKVLGNAPLPPAGTPTVAPEVQLVEKFGPPPSSGVMRVPEPRAVRPTDRPGAMWSVPREELPSAAQRGQPGAADVLGGLGKPMLFEPRGAIGSQPEFGAMRERLLGGQQQTPLTVEKAMGIRWATDGVNRVSIPNNVPDEGIEAYARPKLAEQASIRKNLF